MACWAQAPTAETAQGTVQGRLVDGIAIFRGIPFAAPPVDALRWREPQPAEKWTGVRPANTAGPSCMQKRGMSLENGGDPGKLDEDCLYLNVYRPGAGAGAGLPVMVWIHGGALIFGGGALPIYDGSALARRDVIVVTINYRLGALGFFAHPALDKETTNGPVNFGLLDQVAALRWVQTNIAAFGGDPAKVTIAGQSAGAQSVLALMASPMTSGLFSAAIAESAYGIPSHSRSKARKTGVAIGASLGHPGTQASATALRSIPAKRLADVAQNLSLAPSFIVGDEAVPIPLLEAFQKGREHAVPLIIGNNSDDASVIEAFGVDPAVLVQKMGGARVLIRSLYPGVSDEGQLGREVARDALFTAFGRRIAYLHSAKAPTWRYYFTHADANTRRGAGHGGEVPFVLGTVKGCNCLGRPITPLDRTIERRTSDRWATFVSTQRPSGEIVWPQDDRRRGQVLEIGDQETVRSGFMAPRLNAFIAALNFAGRMNKRER
ncbi:MAG: carboxylesterase/lipase family protein [Pseudomonadota bacterium]